MSYSLEVPAGPKHDVVERLQAEWALAIGKTPELRDHMVAAYAAVPAMAAQVGRPEDHIEVRISGHVNPGHAPGDGYADEACTISVTMVRP